MEMDRYIGRLLDNRYEILEVIGIGGMAVVYKARCHRLNRLVAVKILKDEYSKDEEFRRRFHAESQAVAMLSHPNIVSVYDVSTSDEADYIVMELIDGITLKQYMEKKGVLNWKETLHFAIQICRALEHAHSRGIVHRDIKPHNVMVLKNGSVKVADFGIARVMSKSNTLTKEALGSVHYISPEQAKGGRVDSRSDLYSLGVVMYEMMTGRPPYDGESPVAVAIQHINGRPSMPSTLNPNIPGGLEQIIMKAMTPDSTQRYTTASAMLYDMDEFRKNPAILFDYQNPATDMDAAAKLSGAAHSEAETMVLPRTAAERAAAPQRPRPAPQTHKAPPQTRQPAKRRQKEVIVEDDDRSGKVATVAVIACALVAVVAIVVFVLAILNGGMESQGEVTQVPALLGKTVEELSNVTDITIRVDQRKYSIEYPKGQIMFQNPAAGEKIAKGGIVTVYVSLGPKPQTKIMENVVGEPGENARAFLADVLNLPLENVQIVKENHPTVAAGKVIRTTPASGEEVQPDQIVTLYVSIGQEIRREKVPNVLGQTADRAQALLGVNGFENVRLEEVESTRAKGTVVYQSISQVEVDVTTEIVLQISKGPDTDQPGPEIPTVPPVDPDLVTKIVTVGLSEDYLEPYTLSIWLNGELLEEREIPVGSISTQFALTGKGTMQFELRINGANPWTIDVNFDE